MSWFPRSGQVSKGVIEISDLDDDVASGCQTRLLASRRCQRTGGAKTCAVFVSHDFCILSALIFWSARAASATTDKRKDKRPVKVLDNKPK